MDRFEQDVLIDLFHKSKGNFVVIARCLHHLARLRKIENFKIDASSVRRYYQSHFPDLSVVKPIEINPFDVEPGQQIQIDFVEALFQFVGHDQPTRLYIFEAVYAWSRKRYVRWVSEKWTSRNLLGDNYVLGGTHYETSTPTVHCRV